jgi:site-specific DNA-methyltransferase (adenine-specific)
MQVAATGRRRRYCSPACRQASYRKRANRSVLFSSATSEWATPADLFAKLNKEFCFTLDVCATVENAKCERYFTKKEDGLVQPWTGRVWCNPPYGAAVAQWLHKGWESVQSGACELVVFLLPARTDTAWWPRYHAKGEVRFLKGRLRFGGAKSSAPFPSVLLVFRNVCTLRNERYLDGQLLSVEAAAPGQLNG